MKIPQSEKCVWCIRYELPCGFQVHDNPLSFYVPLIETTNFTADSFRDIPIVQPTQETPTVRRPDYVPPSSPRAGWDARLQRALGIGVPLLIAAIVALCLIMAYALATGSGPAAPEQPRPATPSPTPHPTRGT
jgi:hypothetical protein